MTVGSSGGDGAELDAALRRGGALVTALFALPWALTGASGLAGPVAAVARAGALVGTAVAVLLALRAGATRAGGRTRGVPVDWGRRFNRVGVVQTGAIALVVVLLVVAGVPALIPAAVCLVVGLHFLPLAGIVDQPQYRWTGAVLCLVALAGLGAALLADASAVPRAVVGLGAAATLWGTSLSITARG